MTLAVFMRTLKTLVRRRMHRMIRSLSQSMQCSQWVANNTSCLYADTEDSGQTQNAQAGKIIISQSIQCAQWVASDTCCLTSCLHADTEDSGQTQNVQADQIRIVRHTHKTS